MDASYKIQRGIHVHLIQFFMCPEFWVHIKNAFAFCFCSTHLKLSANSKSKRWEDYDGRHRV